MKKILFILFIILFLFYSLPLFFIKNICASHDERFIINLTLSLPLNSFIMPVNYYGPIQSYFLLIIFSIFYFYGLFKFGSGIEFLKYLYVNNFSAFLFLGKLLSFLFFIFSIFIFYKIIKIKKFKIETLIFFIFIFFTTPIIYQFSTHIKVELLLFCLISMIIYYSLKLQNFYKIRYIIILAILSGFLITAKYNTVFFVVLPIIIILLHSKFNVLKVYKDILLFCFILIIFILILHPSILFDTKNFFSDIKYIFYVVNIGHINFVKAKNFTDNFKIIYNILTSNLSFIYWIFFLFCIFRNLKNIYLLQFFIVIFLFLIFLIKWKFKLNHYIVPILPFVFYLIIFEFDKYSKKIQYFFILFFFLFSINYFYKNIEYIKSLTKVDDRILAKKYIEENIAENSKILLEDLYDYSPYILPADLPIIYDEPKISSRKKLKQIYFENLIKYGRSKKFKLTFLNIPLEGERLLTFKFPDLNFIKNNFDYVIISNSIYYRFKNYNGNDTFMLSAKKFYFEDLMQFKKIKEIGNIKIIKIN